MILSEKKRLCLWLFAVNLMISAFTFGGGYVVIPMIRKYFVAKKRLFTEEALMEMAAVAQSSPGAIAINLSVLAGYRSAGMAGAAVSCAAAVLPPLVILSVISLCYAAFRDNRLISAVLKGMEAGVAALVADLVADLCANVFRERKIAASLLVPAAFAACFFLHINVAAILLCSAGICLLEGYVRRRRAV